MRLPAGQTLGIYNWSTTGAGGNAVVKVTAIDPINKMISGTFSATVVAGGATAISKKTITEGSFSVPYQ